MSSDVPEGWAAGQVLDFFQLQRGHDLPVQYRQPGPVPIIASNGVVGFHDQSSLAGPGVVTGRSGSIGNVSFVEGAYWPLNTALYVRDFKASDPEFVYYFLQNFPLKEHSTGTGVPTLNRNDVHAVAVVFPPYDEQRRIVEVLRSVDGALAANEAVAVQAQRAFQTALTELIGSAPGHWETVRLSQIAELTLGKMLDKEKNKGELRPYLANVNVRWGAFDLHDLRHMRFEERELNRYGLRCGDIVMCEGGEPGRCAVWMDEGSDMMIQKALHRIRPNEGVENHYLYYALVRSARSGAFDEYMTGSGIKHLPGNQLAKVEVSLPPIAEQQSIAGALRLLEQAAGDRQSAFEQAQAMKQSIMSDLLSGRVRVPA